MRVTARIKDYRLLVKVKTALGETVDRGELGRFAQMHLDGFFMPEKARKRAARFRGPIGISLRDRLKSPVTGGGFLSIVGQTGAAMGRLQGSGLPLSHLVMDIRCTFFNEVTKEVVFLYLPLSGKQKSPKPSEFLASILYSARPAQEQDAGIMSDFAKLLKSTAPLDVRRIERFVRGEARAAERTAGEPVQPDPSREGGVGGEETGLLAEPGDEETGLLNEEWSAGGHAAAFLPVLHRCLTGEMIVIDKPVYRLGKEKSYVDYFVNNNIAVSRSHADIIARDVRYFVKDLNSRNHTYVNGQKIPVRMEFEIHEGDRLCLANEEFVFHLREV